MPRRMLVRSGPMPHHPNIAEELENGGTEHCCGASQHRGAHTNGSVFVVSQLSYVRAERISQLLAAQASPPTPGAQPRADLRVRTRGGSLAGAEAGQSTHGFSGKPLRSGPWPDPAGPRGPRRAGPRCDPGSG